MVYSDKSNFAVYYMLQGDSGMEFYHRDGTTKFQTVDFKKGRCVIFPARTVHKEIKPKELTPRFSVCYLFTGLYA
jgi:mannose-6-phosphate isomerase-like protein (cupin superfamily)